MLEMLMFLNVFIFSVLIEDSFDLTRRLLSVSDVIIT